MALAISLFILAVGFGASAYVYALGSRRTCPRCGSRKTGAHLGYAPGPFFNCRQCGAVFDGNGAMVDADQ
jgi:rubredoxin